MNQAVKAEWVAALRSGEYTKGTSRLHAVVNGADQFCVMGVLCDIARKQGITVITHSVDLGDGIIAKAYGNYFTQLPPAVMNWAELELPTPLIDSIDDDGIRHVISLAQLNDALMMSFSELAELIETHLGLAATNC